MYIYIYSVPPKIILVILKSQDLFLLTCNWPSATLFTQYMKNSLNKRLVQLFYKHISYFVAVFVK